MDKRGACKVADELTEGIEMLLMVARRDALLEAARECGEWIIIFNEEQQDDPIDAAAHRERVRVTRLIAAHFREMSKGWGHGMTEPYPEIKK